MPPEFLFEDWRDEEGRGKYTDDDRMGYFRTLDCPLPDAMFEGVLEWCRQTDRYAKTCSNGAQIIDTSYWHTEMTTVGSLCAAHSVAGHLALVETYSLRRRKSGLTAATSGRADAFVFMPDLASEGDQIGDEIYLEAKWTRPVTEDGNSGFASKDLTGKWLGARKDAGSLPSNEGIQRVALHIITPRMRGRNPKFVEAFDNFWDNLALPYCSAYAWWRTPADRQPAYDGEFHWPGVILCFGLVRRSPKKEALEP